MSENVITDIDIEVAFDSIGKALVRRGYDADKIEEYLVREAERVAQEIRDNT